MDITASDRVLRISAVVLLLGALLEGIGAIAAIPADGVGSTNRALWVLIHLVMLLGATALLLGLPALYLWQAREVGVIGLVGFVLLFIGFLGVGFFVAAAQTLLLPWAYDKASCTLGCHLLSTLDGPPLYAWFYVVEELATFVGLILLGLSIARARVASGAGYLMALSGVLSLPLPVIAVAPLVAAVPELLALLAVIWIALRFLTSETP